jgi:hypothetical protein
LVIVFIIAFLKKVAEANDVPDIPVGWQMVILVGLGAAAAKSAAQKMFENKWGKDSTDETNDGEQKPPQT